MSEKPTPEAGGAAGPDAPAPDPGAADAETSRGSNGASPAEAAASRDDAGRGGDAGAADAADGAARAADTTGSDDDRDTGADAPAGDAGAAAPHEPTAPHEPHARIAALEGEVARLEKEKQDTYDRLLRQAADLENFRKRSKRDLEDARIAAKTSVLKEMLPVVDNLELAVQHAESSGAADAAASGVIEGVKLVLRQFSQAFERCDVTPIEAEGQPFDPNVHEAISQVETADHPPGSVAQVYQRGYRIGERLLRPALVVVAKAPPEPEPGAGPNGAAGGDAPGAADGDGASAASPGDGSGSGDGVDAAHAQDDAVED